jgi:hypothetical protein
MPVDLSKVGLEGIESYYSQMESAARTRKLDSSTQAEQAEIEQAERMQQLGEEAARALDDVANRRKTPADDAEAAGEDMESLADPLEIMGRTFARGGAVKQAAEFLSKASEIRKRESDIKDGEVTRQQNRLENIIKGADIVGRKLGGAQNDDEWNQGLKEVEAAGVIEPHLMEQLKSVGYDPDTAAYFRDQAVSAAQKATLDMQQQGLEQRDRHYTVSARNAAARLELAQRAQRELEKHRAAQEKAAGNKAPGSIVPTAQDIKSAETVLRGSAFQSVDLADAQNKADLASASQYVASQAKALLRNNKALDWETALQQAAITAQQSGIFKTTPGTDGIFGTGILADKKRVEVVTPAPLPVKNKKVDTTQLKKGTIYMTARGRARWNGTAFETVN